MPDLETVFANLRDFYVSYYHCSGVFRSATLLWRLHGVFGPREAY